MAEAASQVARALRIALARLNLTQSDTVVVGFSGGQDSTCLLHGLSQLRQHPKLLAAHVDHSLRPDSAESAQRVLELAASFGVEAVRCRVDVPRYRRQRSSWSVQHAARAARYQALARVVEECKAAALLTAHTADDQAETVLLNLLRGAGLGGLAGMRTDEQLDVARLGPPLPGAQGALAVVRLARPLLNAPRTLTRAYCDQEGLSVVEDASNFSRVYTRNRVRLDLLPALERFNPAIRTVLSRTAELAADDLAALDAITAAVHGSLVRRESETELEYELTGWRAQPRPLQRRLLRYALERLLGDLTDVRAQPIEDALDLVRSGHRGQTYHLPYGLELCLSPDRAVLRRHGRAQPRRKLDITLGADPPRV